MLDPKIPIHNYNVGNGGVNTAKWLYSKGLPPQDWMKMFAVDLDYGKLAGKFPTENRFDGVNTVHLLSSDGTPSGAGGNIRIGYEAAVKQSEFFKANAKSLAERKGFGVIHGCLGGGTTGAIPLITQIYRDAGIPVLGVMVMPEIEDEGAEKHDNAQEVVRQFQDAEGALITLHNSLETFDGTMQQRYDHMVSTAIGPMLIGLQYMLLYYLSCINFDRKDLERLARCRDLYMGYYGPSIFPTPPAPPAQVSASLAQPAEATVDEVTRILTTQYLQYADRVLPKSEIAGLLVNSPSWKADLTNGVSRQILSRMKKVSEGDEKPCHPIGLKRGINEESIKEGDDFYFLLAGAGPRPEPEKKDEAIVVKIKGEPVEGVQVPEAPAPPSDEHHGLTVVGSSHTPLVSEAVVETITDEMLMTNPLYTAGAGFLKKITLPKSLYEAWKSEKGKSTPSLTVLAELQKEAHRYTTSTHQDLDGWVLLVPQDWRTTQRA